MFAALDSICRPLTCAIDLAALRHNFSVAKRIATQHMSAANCWAVVKANAYGHGLLPTAEALRAQADGFALIELAGAQSLRAAGITQPILLLEGCYNADELPACVHFALTPVLHNVAQVMALQQAQLSQPLPVYLKLNTGMNRLGLDADEVPQALAILQQSPNVSGITLMTHYADADGKEGIAAQYQRFNEITELTHLPTSSANSAALLRYPECAGQWARAGIMLYGSSPFPQIKSAAELDLQPVMTLQSKLISIRNIAAGARIGYGCTFVAEQPMRIGVVACGYADGYPRHAPTGTPILVDGVRTRTLGRVSMDKLCIDLTDIPRAGFDSTITLWGRGLPADEVAAFAGTVSYELFCAIAARVPMIEQ